MAGGGMHEAAIASVDDECFSNYFSDFHCRLSCSVESFRCHFAEGCSRERLCFNNEVHERILWFFAAAASNARLGFL
jgi:hypothetical protein